MPRQFSNSLQEIETLTKSIEIVLRKMIQFLVGRISLVKLQEMVRFIYVEEAEDQLKKESPSKNVPLTKLAVVTGLDTRTLTRTRNHESYKRPFYKKSAFLYEFSPAADILSTWTSSPRFQDSKTNTPKLLNVEGKEGSFEELFASTIRARGVTPHSLLERLVLSGAVEFEQDKRKVRLVKQSYLPMRSEDKLGAFEVGYSSTANLLDTIVHNFETDAKSDKFFQRAVWTNRLTPQKRLELREALNSILEEAESQGRRTLEAFEEESEHPTQMTAGISLFYFEDNVD